MINGKYNWHSFAKNKVSFSKLDSSLTQIFFIEIEIFVKFLKADKSISSNEQSAEITSLTLLVILSFMKSDLYLVKKNITDTKRNNNVDISKNIFFTTPIYNLLRIFTSFSVKNRYLPLIVFFFVIPAKEVLSNLVTVYPRCSNILLTILFFPI